MNLCQYRDIFGKVGEGAHSVRFAGIAIVDLLLTILASGLLSWIFNWNFWVTLLISILLGIILHRMFCVRTTIDKLIFPNSD
jgi:hypothetical protein